MAKDNGHTHPTQGESQSLVS